MEIVILLTGLMDKMIKNSLDNLPEAIVIFTYDNADRTFTLFVTLFRSQMIVLLFPTSTIWTIKTSTTSGFPSRLSQTFRSSCFS